MIPARAVLDEVELVEPVPFEAVEPLELPVPQPVSPNSATAAMLASDTNDVRRGAQRAMAHIPELQKGKLKWGKFPEFYGR
jgi:hypothetical protein